MADLNDHIEAIARDILGNPNPSMSNKKELRFGTQGSVSVMIEGDKKGSWYDHERRIGGGTLDFLREKANLVNGAAFDYLRDKGFDVEQPAATKKWKFIEHYIYLSEAGDTPYRVCRWLKPDGLKTFTQERWDGSGWVKGKGVMTGVRLVPYHLPDLIKAVSEGRLILIPEGEKDVDNLRSLGFAATCNPGGAEKWPSHFAKYFRGADVIILLDNDEAGERHCAMVAKNLLSINARVRYLRMPQGTPYKQDISWCIENSHLTAEQVDAMLDSATEWNPSTWEQKTWEHQEDPPKEAKGTVSTATARPTPPTNTFFETPDDVVTAFNEKYAVVNEGGKVVIYNPKRDYQLERNVIERIAFEDFRRMYMNRRIKVGTSKKGNDIFEDIGTVWLEHKDRCQYLGGVVMDPTNTAPGDYWNLWKGFNVDPRPGNWSLMHDHIKNVICCGDEVLFNYVMGWLARMVQLPNKPGEVALVLRGKKGTGKGTLGNVLCRLLGQHSLHIYHAKHLVGNFNAHLRDAVFVFADEAFFAGDKQHEGVLKGLVTEPHITIEAKHQNAVTIANMTHILMASNSEWVVPASSDERRFCVMDVSEERMGDTSYFDKLNEQMNRGGLSAMLHDLLNRDISSFNVRKVPDTKALADQKLLSMDTLHRWWLSVLQRGFVWKSRHGHILFDRWDTFVTTELLWQSYLQWCNGVREGRPMSREHLGRMMNGVYKQYRTRTPHPIYEIEAMDPNDKKPAVMKEMTPGYLVGDIGMARKSFAEKNKMSFDWGEYPDA